MALKYDPEQHSRHSVRLPGYDYAQPGAYFVTVCTKDRECLFGEVVNGEIALNEAGKMVKTAWEALPRRFPTTSVDMHVIMPNHFHGIIIVGVQFIASQLWPQGVINHAPTLGNIVRVFKAITTRRIRTRNNREFAWQRNYHEHIIRNEAELHCIRQYIFDNPLHWETDRENPCR